MQANADGDPAEDGIENFFLKLVAATKAGPRNLEGPFEGVDLESESQ
jgi:hypothetical protein